MNIFFNHFNKDLSSLSACQGRPNTMNGEKNEPYPQNCLEEQGTKLYFMPVNHSFTPEEVAIVVNEYGSQVLVVSAVIGW